MGHNSPFGNVLACGIIKREMKPYTDSLICFGQSCFSGLKTLKDQLFVQLFLVLFSH